MEGLEGRLTIEIPYEPRPQFLPFHDRTQRWSVTVAHRRCGKTVARVNDLIRGALSCPLPDPRFAYVAPLFTQAKDVAWTYLKRFAGVVPNVQFNESELRADFPNGGRVRLYGADNYERMRGIYLDGAVMDEYGGMDPSAWSEVIRPTLSDRNGWADFIGTPNGNNHFADLWREHKDDPAWYAAMLRASETKLLSDAELADARKAMTQDQYEQEYECSFQAAVVGAYYARELGDVEKQNRISTVPWSPEVPVHTSWDLGIGDSTAIWFGQIVGKEIRFIDFLENAGVGLDWYARELKAKPYVYGDHILPHDANARSLDTGRSRVETLRSLGINGRVLSPMGVADGINAVRLMLPSCWFDQVKCERGLNALRNYRREWDEKRKVFNDRPTHDWSSHASDSFRYFALGRPDSAGWGKPIDYKWINKGIV